MTGYFDRLAKRAQGGDAVRGLPMARPLPSVYGGSRIEPAEADIPLEFEAETLAPKPAIVRGGLPPLHAGADKGDPSAIAPRQGERSVEHAADHRGSESRPSSAAPNHQPVVREFEPDHAEEVLRSAAAVSPPHVSVSRSPALQKSEPDREISRPRSVLQKGKELPPDSTSSPQDMGAIERIFEAIEATPPAFSADERPIWNERAPWQKEPQELPPPVSIGRIDIVVAPPAVPPAPPDRTYGFQSYARLRRGLVR